MIAKNKTTQKIISALLIISILAPSVLFSMPKQTVAQVVSTDPPLIGVEVGHAAASATNATANTTSLALKIKDAAKEILKQILMTVARKLLQDMTKSTINWVNSGFHGSPLFLQNPESFFKDIAKYEIRTMVDMFGYDPNKFPFGKDFALNTINAYKRTLDNNAAYTLNKVMTEPQARQFRDNFNVGGWNGFLINTQYPQNNYLGFQMIATEALAKKLQGTTQNAAQKVQTTLAQGAGFLSPQKCVTNPNYNSDIINEFKPPTFDNDAFIKANPYKPPEPKDCGSLASAAGNPTAVLAYQQCTIKNQTDLQNYKASYNATAAVATASFDDPKGSNRCPNKPDGSSGLEATTPGSVVGNKIMTALNMSENSTLQAVGLGNSISAILDALLNKFLDKGLNALATKINPPPPKNATWTYDGQSLGSPAEDAANKEWTSGPDEPIILSDFRKKIEGKTVTTGSVQLGTCTYNYGVTIMDNIPQAVCLALSITAGTINGGIATGGASWVPNLIETTLTKEEVGNIHNCTYDGDLKKWCSSTAYTYIPGDIENTKAELQLIYNESPTNPGITQLQSRLWLKSRELDICQPGPDLGWKDRMTEEKNRNSIKLQGKTSDSDGNLAAEAQLASRELKFAVDFFTDWINNKMMTALPHSVLFMDAVEEIEVLSQQSNELTDKKRIKNQALARLESIKTGLKEITKLDSDNKIIQPPTGSSDEGIMVSLYKQYKATADAISNPTSVDNMFNELTVTYEKLVKLNKLVPQCQAERAKITISNEKNEYCDAPIKGGYNHESFTHANDGEIAGAVTNDKIPYVNANKVLRWKGLWGIFSYSASIKMSCNIIWKANILDYKGNLPGTPETANIVEPYAQMPDDTGDANFGTCSINTTEIINTTTGETKTTTNSDSNMTQEDCTASGGSWAPNTPTVDPVANPSATNANMPRVQPPTSPY